MTSGGARQSLIVGAGSWTCAIPTVHVVETMRPLPVEPLAEMPGFVLGLSVIRGAPVPVVDLGEMLGATKGAEITRYVTITAGARRVALAVAKVVGVRAGGDARLDELPPLLGDARADVVEALGVLDAQLLLVLRAGRIVPADVWQAIERRGAPS